MKPTKLIEKIKKISNLMAKDVIITSSDEKLIEKMKKRPLEIISDHQI